MQMWLFGYGSLIWRPDFTYKDKILGCVKGYCIRFWQESVIFRGTPDKPGRVAALVEDSLESEVWGVAYKLEEDKSQDVLGHLMKRELHPPVKTTFYPKDESQHPFEVSVYNVATRDGIYMIQYVGPEKIDNTAKVIAESVGTTGMRNDEYVFKLAEFIREEAEREDPYLFSLENLVKECQETKSSTDKS